MKISLTFNRIKKTGTSKIIVDTDDLLNDPETMLKLICNTLGITWYSQMLSWKKGQNLRCLGVLLVC